MISKFQHQTYSICTFTLPSPITASRSQCPPPTRCVPCMRSALYYLFISSLQSLTLSYTTCFCKVESQVGCRVSLVLGFPLFDAPVDGVNQPTAALRLSFLRLLSLLCLRTALVSPN